MLRIPSSQAECKARAPECRALVESIREKLGSSHIMTMNTSNQCIPVEAQDLWLVGNTGRNGPTLQVDVCTDGIINFFLNELAEKGTMWELEYEGVLWTFM